VWRTTRSAVEAFLAELNERPAADPCVRTPAQRLAAAASARARMKARRLGGRAARV
jgi:hypothetical protein